MLFYPQFYVSCCNMKLFIVFFVVGCVCRYFKKKLPITLPAKVDFSHEVCSQRRNCSVATALCINYRIFCSFFYQFFLISVPKHMHSFFAQCKYANRKRLNSVNVIHRMVYVDRDVNATLVAMNAVERVPETDRLITKVIVVLAGKVTVCNSLHCAKW